MALTGAASRTINTDSNGTYQFTELANGSYVVTPSKTGYVFTPPSGSITVSNANITGQDFTATLATWAKAYGGVNHDVAHCIQQASDGGFIVAGETSSFGVVNPDVWVLKLDVNGSIQWQKIYGGIGFDIGRSIQQTADGGYIVAGETSSFGTDTDVWILKLNADGTIRWQNRYGGNGVNVAYSVQQTSEGGYIVAGETTPAGAAAADAFVLKLKSDGSTDWQKSYGGAGDDRAWSIRQASDGGFIVAGETNSYGAGGFDIWVWKLDASGSVAWQKTFGGNKDDTAYSVRQTSDGGYIIAGGATPAGSIFNDVFLLKLDASGSMVWGKTYGGANNDVAFSVQQTSDGGYIIAGKNSPNPITSNMWVLKLDSNGGVVWEKTYGGQGSNSANFVFQNSDGGYSVTGETSFGAGDADAWALKLDENGNIGSGCSIVGSPNAAGVTAGFIMGTSPVIVTPTNALATATSASPLDSAATTTTQCSFP
jgi:uncharacterized delta-60 repeat protein